MGTVEDLNDKADALFDAGKFIEAARKYSASREILAKCTTDSAVEIIESQVPNLLSKLAYNEAMCYSRLSQPKETLGPAVQAVKLDKRNDQAFLHAAWASEQLGLVEDALDYFEKAKALLQAAGQDVSDIDGAIKRLASKQKSAKAGDISNQSVGQDCKDHFHKALEHKAAGNHLFQKKAYIYALDNYCSAR